MVAIASLVPSCSYAAGTFTIPWTAINAATSVDSVAADSAERLLHDLLTILFEKQNAGTIDQTKCGVEISSVSVTQGTWETSVNSFSDRILQSFLVVSACARNISTRACQTKQWLL